MGKKYIIALDEGTTSARALVYDVESERIVGVVNKPFRQIYPRAGWVEHDPDEIWSEQLAALLEVKTLLEINFNDVYALGITNQRETVVVWNKETGEPVYNAIVWQCRRTSEYCSSLIDAGYSGMIKEKTGLKIDAYFSATKIKWILDNVDGARKLADEGKLCAGTIDTFLIWKLTAGEKFVTDYSNASRTLLFNIHTLKWDEELLRLFGIPESMLPKVVDSSSNIGKTAIFGDEIVIGGIVGDQQSALFGQACFEEGMAKNTYGTGCFMLLNTGKKYIPTKELLTTIAWGIDGNVTYALEGSIFNAGSVVQWMRDEVKLIEKASDTEEMCLSVPDTDGVYFVPAFTGLGAPYWNMDARGTLIGITRGINKNHIVRAGMESMAYNTKAIFGRMLEESGITLKELRCDGGVSKDNFLMQFQADMLGCSTNRQQSTECTAMGAVYLAGLATGAFSSLEEISNKVTLIKRFTPSMPKDEVERRYNGWKKAVKVAEYASKL
ncbi:MAG: glycerol kinase GlpK [Clostridia bacterium]|nr:glycerol kinase GlpK [Clostridia bacterium]